MLFGTERGNRVARRAASELQVALGAEPPLNSHAGVRARAAWQRGDLSVAVAIASAAPSAGVRRYGERLASERDLLTAGYRLRLPVEAWVRPEVTDTSGSMPSGIRVMHMLTNSLPWTQSGYAVRSHAILRAQAEAGMTVEAMTRVGYPVIVGLPQARDVDVIDGVPYRRVVPSRLASTPTCRLEQLADAAVLRATTFRPDVIHTTTHYPNAVVAQAVAERCDLPWVYEVRGQLEKTWVASRPAAQQTQAANSERYRLAAAREVELARAADHVVTLSQSLKDDLVARGVPAERITLVPNAVDVPLVDRVALTSPREARRRLGLPEAGFWVGTVSSLVDYEGLDVLLDAVALLRRDGLDIRCAIVGDGVSRPALVAHATRLGLDDVVVFPGRVPRADAVRWHEALDTFVVPRRDTEVCRTVTPLKPIEAMALGRPVVASDLPALAEIIADPGAGLVAAAGDVQAFADTLQTIFADVGLRERLSTAGRAFAATRTWRANAARYREIYESLGVSR
jgi:glycosyltransferase involved in cell wall biosynthesis